MPLFLVIWALWQLDNDRFGYYVDTIGFVWVEVEGTNRIELTGWRNTGLLEILPGTFWFYGENFDHVAICSNGWISFQVTRQDLPASWPDSLFPYSVALFVVGGGADYTTIWWDTIGSKLVIEYDMVPLLGGELKFETIIDVQDSSIIIAYKEHDGYDWWEYPGPGGSSSPIIGIAGENVGLQVSPYGLVCDNMAIRFFYYPYPDVEIPQLIYPGNNYILHAGVPESIVVRVQNNGPQSLDHVWVNAKIRRGDVLIFNDSVDVTTVEPGGISDVSFYPWIADEFVDYQLEVTLTGWHDMQPANDTLKGRLKAPGGFSDTIHYDDGDLAGSYCTEDTSWWVGVSFVTDTNALIKMVAVYLLTEDDPGFGVPDSMCDPIEIGLWYREVGEWLLWDKSILLRDNVQPGWVYYLPPDSLIADTILVGVRLTISKGGEALGMDVETDYPENKWIKYGVTPWIQYDYGDGDPLVRVYTYNGEVKVMEKPSDRIWVRNPAHYIEMYKISCNSVDRLLVYDITGRLIDKVEFIDGVRVGEDLPSGAYFLVFKMRGDKKEDWVKWIKIR